VKPQYIPNEAKLESVTTQRANYQPHLNVQPPKRREQPKWKSTSGKFDGVTTSKTDFVEMNLPPRYVRPVAQYVKSAAKFEGLSTQTEDYKEWEVHGVPTRRKPTKPAATSAEDRYTY
jgi:hypothetical protein